MPIALGEKPRLEPERELLRVVEGLEGEVDTEILFQPRFDYARREARLVQRGALGWFCEHRGEALLLGSEVQLAPAPGGGALGGRALIRAGERRRLSLAYAMRDMLVAPPLGTAADARLARTVEWWRGWSGQCRFDHPYRPAVLRSALALKLLTYSLSGAVVAAVTTSLPEAIGAERNWDYRYCWLRDAATTLQAFMDLGFRAEGRAYLEWLLHSTRLTQPRLQILYDVYGRTRLPGEELDHLEGYRKSRPVRVGNDASQQVQLDIYGSAVAATALYADRGGSLSRDEQRLMHGFGRVVCETWREPDSGLWEFPGERRHFTHSKLMCWTALDSLVRLHGMGRLMGPVDRYRRERDAIRAAIEARGFDAARGCYVGAFGEDWLDASLLVMAKLGYRVPDDPRVVSTAARIRRELARDELIHRYAAGVDGLPSREGAFGICSFWAVELLALQGAVDEARDLFERMLARANDVGLLAEEFDPATGEALGNVPQAYTHAGLIAAALAIADAERRRAEGEAAPPC
jgi:GH15 family glucan-1,4-alpha-glucosidase